MKDIENMISVFHEGTEYTEELSDFSKDSATLTLASSEFLYLGRETPFTACYFYPRFSNSVDTSLTIEYWDGSSWVALTSSQYSDDTSGLSRSGFIQWKPITSWTKVEYENLSQYWVRFSLSLSSSEMEITSLNLLFSDDTDLKREYYPIDCEQFKLDATDYVLLHESIRDGIVQRFRNRGLRRISNSESWRRLTAFNLIDIQEVRLASVHGVLERIFLNVSDDPEDSFYQRAKYHRKKYEEYLSVAFLSIDIDGSGDADQQSSLSSSRLIR